MIPYIKDKLFKKFCGQRLTLACSTENLKMSVTIGPGWPGTVTDVMVLFIFRSPPFATRDTGKTLSTLYLNFFLYIYRCNRSILVCTFYRNPDAQIDREVQAQNNFLKFSKPTQGPVIVV